MSIHVVFNGIGDSEKAQLESYWKKKLPRIEKRLVRYRENLREVRLTVSYHQHSSSNPCYEVRGVVHLPTGTLAAESNDKDVHAALDRVADLLVAEINRHNDRVRHESVYKRKNRDRAALSAAGPILEQHKENGRQEDFFKRLSAHLGALRRYALRELTLLEKDGMLHRGEATVDDLLDEVLSRAWEQFSDRPRHLPLDLWLTGLVDDTLEEWVKQEPRHHASLEQRVTDAPRDEASDEDDEDWWVPVMGEEETFSLGDLIPDVEETESWGDLPHEEQRERVFSLLLELPRAQRQAFVLHALDDYNTEEIAMLQDRPESEVKADVEAVRRRLKERLLAAGYVQATDKQFAAARTPADADGN